MVRGRGPLSDGVAVAADGAAEMAGEAVCFVVSVGVAVAVAVGAADAATESGFGTGRRGEGKRIGVRMMTTAISANARSVRLSIT